MLFTEGGFQTFCIHSQAGSAERPLKAALLRSGTVTNYKWKLVFLGLGCSSETEHMFSMGKALVLIPSKKKEEKKEGRTKKEEGRGGGSHLQKHYVKQQKTDAKD
jgi:hypothetical protein